MIEAEAERLPVPYREAGSRRSDRPTHERIPRPHRAPGRSEVGPGCSDDLLTCEVEPSPEQVHLP